MKQPSKTLVPPDGGWGWMVCLGFGLIIFSLRSLDPSFGLLFGDLLKQLGVETTGATFITSLSDSIYCFSGLFAGPLMKKIGFRKTGLLGSLLGTTGLILTSQATSFTHLICTYSILTGMGAGLAATAGVVAVNTYFVKKRTQGMGFAMAGSSIGMMCLPQVVYFLLIIYDYRGAVLVIASISFHALVGSCLLQPISRHLVPAVPARKEEMELEKVEGSALLKPEFTEIEGKTTCITEKPSNVSGDSEGGNNRRVETSCVQKLIAFFDFDMLKSPTFLNLLIGLSMYYVYEVNFKMLSPFFLTSIGMTKQEVALALSLTAFADVASRLTMPTIVMRLKFKNRHVFWISSILSGISRSVMVEQKPGKLLTANLILIGLLRGITMTNMTVCVAEKCDIVKLPTAVGMMMVSRGLFVVVLGPLIGFIRDYTGSYQACVHCMTGLIIACAVAWAVEFVAEKMIRVRKEWAKVEVRKETA